MQKLHIGRVGSTSSSSSSRADNYNAYHKLAVAVAEVWGSAILDTLSKSYSGDMKIYMVVHICLFHGVNFLVNWVRFKQGSQVFKIVFAPSGGKQMSQKYGLWGVSTFSSR